MVSHFEKIRKSELMKRLGKVQSFHFLVGEIIEKKDVDILSKDLMDGLRKGEKLKVVVLRG